MRDAVELERRDIPTVMVTEDVFQTAAQSLATALGLPDLQLVVVPQLKRGMTDEDKETFVHGIAPQVAQGLTKKS